MSFLCSSKRGILGQKLRQLIYKNQSILELRTGRELSFWRSGKDELLPQVCRRGNRILGIASGAKKDLHLPFQFSIILENSQQDNYFTEKLIDCLLCKTVPIYWGCPNIGAYFDARGIIILRSIDGGIIEELVMQLKKCGPEFYEQRREAIENNYDMAFNYAFNYSERLKKLIHT
uniref:Fucosyltransferase C-terminal domain-containing protein n=1 Tax=viral metagenome TaxID=1070528 RepID=A0A6C0JWF9_9ZZZZ